MGGGKGRRERGEEKGEGEEEDLCWKNSGYYLRGRLAFSDQVSGRSM